MRVSKTHLVWGRITALVQIISGTFLLLFFGICTVACVDLCRTNGAEYAIPFLLCLGITVVGGWLIFRGWKQKRLARCSDRYADILSDRKSISIQEIGKIMGKDPNTVQKELAQMIHKGYLEQVYIDQSRGLVVCLDENGVHIQPMKAVEPAPKMVAVTCQACGGVTKIPARSVGICDYCGSKIQDTGRSV